MPKQTMQKEESKTGIKPTMVGSKLNIVEKSEVKKPKVKERNETEEIS